MSNASNPAANALNGDIVLERGRYFDEDDIDDINNLLRITRIFDGMRMILLKESYCEISKIIHVLQ